MKRILWTLALVVIAGLMATSEMTTAQGPDDRGGPDRFDRRGDRGFVFIVQGKVQSIEFHRFRDLGFTREDASLSIVDPQFEQRLRDDLHFLPARANHQHLQVGG